MTTHRVFFCDITLQFDKPVLSFAEVLTTDSALQDDILCITALGASI